MNNNKYPYLQPINVHDALARAHADRAEYVRIAFTEVPVLLKRLVARLRPNRQRMPRTGAWA